MIMAREEVAAALERLEEEEAGLRRRLEQLEDIVQNAPGSHRPGAPSPETIKTEREITGVVLALSDLDRRRQELTVSSSLGR
jgi:hypothetical protein